MTSDKTLTIQKWSDVKAQGVLPRGDILTDGTRQIKFCCKHRTGQSGGGNLAAPFSAPFYVIKVCVGFCIVLCRICVSYVILCHFG